MKKIAKIQSRRVATYCISVLVILCVACENNPTEEYEPQLNVVGILNSMEQVQHVLVDQTYPLDEQSGQLIDDALVVLSGNGFIDTLVFSYSNYRYWSRPFGIAPLDTYRLMVAKEGFDTITAMTTVPGYFTILYPWYSDTVTLQDTMVIGRSTNAAVYSCSFVEIISNLSFFFWYEPDPLDSLIRIPIGEYLGSALPGRYAITAVACDSNVYEYYFVEDDSIRQAGVTGGVGLFGSTWSAHSSMYLMVE